MNTIHQIITIIVLLQSYATTKTITPSTPLTEEQAIAVLTVAGWDASIHDEALAIMECESELLPTARGDYNYGEPYSLGLMQIHWEYTDNWSCEDREGFIGYYPYFHCAKGFTGSPFDPVANLEVARMIYDRNGGWGMWSCWGLLE